VKYLGYPVGEMIARGWLVDPRSVEPLDPRDKPAVRAALLRFFELPPDTKDIRRAAREKAATWRVACVLTTDDPAPSPAAPVVG